jgi:hypothetical protein
MSTPAAETNHASASQVANIIRQLRGMASEFRGSGAQYTGFATGRDLAPPLDSEDMRDYLTIALEILARSHAGLDPVNDLDPLLAVSLLRAVLGQL